ncbi:hypothetical protein [Rhodoferax sp.]|uniref:hypothetical protein n=1 Tax=Rhodoferax sp. TaxID=50421 RepID=UPI002ACDA13F|nr:hypothetical protein [Rhodoferax sp.]MDZ7922385.1 hypothetical protein [Rhodoferax sp.]
MSVINKMLRDLDQRQSPAHGAADPLRRNTASIPAIPPVRRPSPALRWATALLPVAALVAGGFAWWSFQHPKPDALPPVPTAIATESASLPVPVAIAASAPEPAPVQAPAVLAAPAEVAVQAPAPAVSASGPPRLGLRMESSLSSSSSPSASPAVRSAAPAVAAAPVAAVSPAVSASAAPSVPAMVAQAPLKTSTSAIEPVQPGARQQQAGREALAQAQAMWASGARDSAISTLQEAVATAERSANNATLVPMVRELARMELAEGRSAAVWELLTRMEPLLANQPELWALRANAAQRLGRHQDSVLAYTTALQSRPSEQRWLLGAAVSLAALGQTAAAAEMADKARAVGPVSREVLAYLRQQGVPLTDRP